MKAPRQNVCLRPPEEAQLSPNPALPDWENHFEMKSLTDQLPLRLKVNGSEDSPLYGC